MINLENRIIVSNPKENTDPRRRFTYPSLRIPGLIVSDTDLESSLLSFAVTKDSLSPASHPKAVELFAGDGPWARRLVDSGWGEKDVTCIDIAKTPTPLIDSVNWMYIDLLFLTEVIQTDSPIPKEITRMKGMFDVVCLSYGPISGNNNKFDQLIRFFARSDGYSLGDQQGRIS